MAGIEPQPGPQEAFLATPADIAIYGGAAGAGKTMALVMEPLRHINNSQFGAVIFRRVGNQITAEGGLWDTAMSIYPKLGAQPKMSPRQQFVFPSGAKASFAHLQYEADVLGWDGTQIPLICFDELQHFLRSQFFYMMSRNRSTCGIRPYIRATCNPDADSWLADFISWWIDQETGFPIQSHSGVIRYFSRVSDEIVWGGTPAETAKLAGCGVQDVKSVTFIAASIYDNRILLEKDPGYLANLKAMSKVERARLLEGNWKIRPAAGLYFKRTDVAIIDVMPTDVIKWVRRWDLASTEPSESNPNPDWTAGVKIGLRKSGRYIVCGLEHGRWRAHAVRELVKRVAGHDGYDVRIGLSQDPGQAGKDQVESYVASLAGYNVAVIRETGDKVARAEPFAAQWQAGNVDVLRGGWNDAFFGELESFPGKTSHDDIVDSASGAFAMLCGRTFDLSSLI